MYIRKSQQQEKEQLHKKSRMGSNDSNLSVDCTNDVMITMRTANEVTNYNSMVYEVTLLKLQCNISNGPYSYKKNSNIVAIAGVWQ